MPPDLQSVPPASPQPRAAWTAFAKQAARAAGFDAVGIATAAVLDAEATDLAQFLAEGRHGTMDWLARDPHVRTDPRHLLPDCQSVLVVLKNYHPSIEDAQPPDAPRISTYAWGHDYHRVLKQGLQQVADRLTAHTGIGNHRACVDSAPLMDKAWAQRAGLGWIGKHTNLLRQPGADGSPGGSWFFIGVLLTAVPLLPDGPVTDHCGTCTRCIDACPTQALTPYQMDARRCISYLTIERKDHLTPDDPATHGWAYGCDICQLVCPWNRFAQAHDEPFFRPLPHTRLTTADWQTLPGNQYKRLTRPTAMSRIRREKWLANIRLASHIEPDPA